MLLKQSTAYENNIKECHESNWWTAESLIILEDTNEKFLTSADHLRDAAAGEIRFCFFWQLLPYEVEDDFKAISRNFVTLTQESKNQILVRKKDKKIIRIDDVVSEKNWTRKLIRFTTRINRKYTTREIIIERNIDPSRGPLPSTTIEYKWKIYKSAKDHWDVWNHTIKQREHADELIFKPMVEAWLMWPKDRLIRRNYLTIHDITELYPDWSWDLFVWVKEDVVKDKTEEEVLEIMMLDSGLFLPTQIALNKEMVSFMEWGKKKEYSDWAAEKIFYLEAALNMYKDNQFYNWWILTAADVFAYQIQGFINETDLVHFATLVDSKKMKPMPLGKMPWSKEFFISNQNIIFQLADEVKNNFKSLPLHQRQFFNKNKEIPYTLTKKFRKEFPDKKHLPASSRDRVNSLYSWVETLQTKYSNLAEI